MHNVDKVQIYQDKLERANNQLAVIESNSQGSPVSFLKNVYGFKKIRESVNDIDFKVTLSVALTRICALAGIKSETTISDSEDISKMILSVFNELSIEEIYKAFELERYGVYDEKTSHFGVWNAEYVSAVLKKYRIWKVNTKHQHNISAPKTENQISDEEKLQIINNGIVRVFNEWKSDKNIQEPFTHVFEELYQRKLFPFNQNDYSEAYSLATDQIKKELEISPKESVSDVKALRVEIKNILDNRSEKVLVRAKKIILIKYFKMIESKKLKIEDVVNAK